MYDIAEVSANPTDKIFKSRTLSAPIKENKEEVDKGYAKFSENETNFEVISQQATGISREVMKENLTRWINELKLNSSKYDDLNDLLNVAEGNYWPQHLQEDMLWETTQPNKAQTNWLYFYVNRSDITDSDTQKFDLAICHLITHEVGISRNVLIGGLIKKGLLLKDGDNIYLKFR